MHVSDTRECFTSHLGLWAMEPKRLSAALAAIKGGTLKPHAMRKDDPSDPSEEEKNGYSLQNGVAVITLEGAMRKKTSKFGGCSTVETRRGIRNAVSTKDVAAIMYVIDSPGGQVAGLDELAEEMRAAARVKKSAAYIRDLGASAAYWAACSLPQIFCNRTAEVGSLGVLSVLVDESGALEREGIKVHVVSTGPYKGLGADGKVTDKLIEQVRGQVDALGSMFREQIAKGRKLDDKQVAKLFTGEIWMAADALKHGLVDKICPMEEAMSALRVAGVLSNMNAMTQEKKGIVLDATSACASLATSTQALGDTTMLTEETVAKIIKDALAENSKSVEASMDAKIEALRTELKAAPAPAAAKEEPKTGVTYTAEEANKLITEAAENAQAKARAEFERTARIKERASAVVKNGSLVPEAEIIKQLSACESEALETARYDALMAQAELSKVRNLSAAKDTDPKAKTQPEYWEAEYEERAKKGEIDVPKDEAKRAAHKRNYVETSMGIPALMK